MKPAYFALLIFFVGFTLRLSAQTDSALAQQRFDHRDSLYAAKLNYTGNLMIGGGVGLVAAGSFLIYEGVETYNTTTSSGNPTNNVAQNHSQGTAYIAAGTIAFIGAAVLLGLGARNKIEFKRRKQRMALQAGLLDNGNVGAMLSF